MRNKELHLLPFQFSRFDNDDYLLVNESGEYIFIREDDFHKLIQNDVTNNFLLPVSIIFQIINFMLDYKQ